MVQGCAIHHGFEQFVYVPNGLVNMYARCGDIKSASKVFDEMKAKELGVIFAYVGTHPPHQLFLVGFMLGKAAKVAFEKYLCRILLATTLKWVALIDFFLASRDKYVGASTHRVNYIGIELLSSQKTHFIMESIKKYTDRCLADGLLEGTPFMYSSMKHLEFDCVDQPGYTIASDLNSVYRAHWRVAGGSHRFFSRTTVQQCDVVYLSTAALYNFLENLTEGGALQRVWNAVHPTIRV
ncbi:Pentatricopeptide repeat-containing protein [Dendrobium catenatum]|uniref:Pentatricopeptide repeat-containing protein n=1 Tax=Dendrobium catenatum TaxID=906689 RepID=A0A2I0VDK8_9ASPA|nr:Pentatricopeptide repeat-containing protein [Dendrobium catenatum]